LIRFKAQSDPTGEPLYGEPQINQDGTIGFAKVITGDIYGSHTVTERVVPVAKLLSPIQPTNIICIGLNYKKHAAETNSQLSAFPNVFMKTLNASQNPFDPIVIARVCDSPSQVDYEAELAFVIGKHCKNATLQNALDFVAGYTCANDVSARTWQQGVTQWCFGKSFDTFCPLGPVLVSTSVISDPNKLQISAILNNKIVQKSNTSDMIFDVRRIIVHLSQGTTLLPGTVVLTGTPEGVGFARKPPIFLQPNDTITIEIEKIGKLTNPVVKEQHSKL